MAPNTALNVLAPAPNSGVFVLPITIAPAAFSRSTTRPSASGTWCSKIFDPHVVRIPFVGVRSLIDTGTPCNGPSLVPFLPIAAVALRAAATACSPATVQYAFSLGFTFSIRPSTARTTSSGDTLRRLYSETSSAACAKQSSSSFMGCPWS